MKNPTIFMSIQKLNIQDQSTRNYVERLQQLALHDPLTKLPNRTLFMDRLNTAIRKAKRSDLKLALLFIDLDKFKTINDAYGHSIGDEVLKHTARILHNSIRESDTSARMGGDEFTILLEGLKDTSMVGKIAMGILGKLKRPFRVGGLTLNISGSIGIAQYPKDATDQCLIDCADYALSQAKLAGPGKYSWFIQ